MAPQSATAEPEAAEQAKQHPSLLADLERLGSELLASELPSPNDVRKFVGAIVHYLQTGKLDAPERPEPGSIEAGGLGSPEQQEIARLRAELAERDKADAGPSVTEPSPVAPPPLATPAETSAAPLDGPAPPTGPTPDSHPASAPPAPEGEQSQ